MEGCQGAKTPWRVPTVIVPYYGLQRTIAQVYWIAFYTYDQYRSNRKREYLYG